MRPTFTFSLDTELMWGSFDKLSVARFQQRYPDLRGTIARIIDMLDELDISATWAVVGHLFLDDCERGADGRAHPDIVRPSFDWRPGDWLSRDPCTDRDRDPLWYGPDILDMIQGARARHEIGSHGFSHAIFGDEGMSRDAARSDLETCIQLAAKRGIDLKSFVLPRNREGHHDLLAEFGFTSFRGADRAWYDDLPPQGKRGADLFDQWAGLSPQVHLPVEHLPGLWDIRGSMLLLHRVGVRRWVSINARVLKAKRGLKRALEEDAVFHLWTHPMNLASDPEAMLGGLRAILTSVADMRDRGLIEVSTMQQVAGSAAVGRMAPDQVDAMLTSAAVTPPAARATHRADVTTARRGPEHLTPTP